MEMLEQIADAFVPILCLLITAGGGYLVALLRRQTQQIEEELDNETASKYIDLATDAVEQAVEQVFDLRPTAIIRDLDLRKPIYRQLAAYGHMGREDLGVSWEKTDRVDALKSALQ